MDQYLDWQLLSSDSLQLLLAHCCSRHVVSSLSLLRSCCRNLKSAAGWGHDVLTILVFICCENSTLFRLCKLMTNHPKQTLLISHSFQLADGAQTQWNTWHISFQQVGEHLGTWRLAKWILAASGCCHGNGKHWHATDSTSFPVQPPLSLQPHCSLISPCRLCGYKGDGWCRRRTKLVRQRLIFNQPIRQLRIS